MNRRPTASGRPATSRSQKTTKAKRRTKPSEASGRGPSAGREKNEVARLTRELEATSEVLKMVSSSSSELDLVFRAILEKATRICEADFGFLFRLADGVIQTVVSLGVPPVLLEILRPGFGPGPSTATARALRTGRPIHIPDIRQEKGYLEGDPMLVTGADKAGIRSLLAVPMVHNQVAIGSIAIYRTEVRPFTDKQIALVTNSPPKQSSPSRTRGCLMNCVSALLTSPKHWNSKLPQEMCLKSSVAQHSIFKRSLRL